MELKVTKDNGEVKLYINEEDGISVDEIESKLLEEFVESCLAGDAILNVDTGLEDYPISKLFLDLYEIKDSENDFNISMKKLDAELEKKQKEEDGLKEEIKKSNLPF